MPGANNILPFAQGGGANVQAQIPYAADAQRGIGNQPGDARSSFVNKILRQAVAMAAAFAQFTADNQGSDVDDTLVPSAMSTLFQNALTAFMAALQVANQNLTGGIVSGYIKFPGGFILQWVSGTCDALGDLSLTLPLTFPTAIIGGVANEDVPSGWGATGACTVWGFDSGGSTTTTAKAKARSVTVGSIVPSAGISGVIFVWGH